MAQLVFVYLGEEFPMREVPDADAAEEAARLNSRCGDSGGIVIVKRSEVSAELEPEYSCVFSE